MSTLKRELRMKTSSILAKYNIDDLGLEMDIVDLFYPYIQRPPDKKGVAESLRAGVMGFDSISGDCVKYLKFSPNWKTTDNSDLMAFLKLCKEAGQTVEKYSVWYWGNHWKGKQGQPPSSKDIRETWYAAFPDTLTTPVTTNDGGLYV